MLKELYQGKEAENLVKETLTKAGYICEFAPPKTLGFDIKFGLAPNEYLAEVKFDVMASRTGNIAIEYWNSKSNKPSGVTSTQSNLWFQIIGNEKQVWVIKTADLRLFIQNEKPLKMISKGGNKNSDMLIYTIEQFTKACTRLDTLSNYEVFQKLQCLLST